MNTPLYSIGYATKDVDLYIAQLKRYEITAVVDIRSVPFSKVFFDFHQDALRNRLKHEGIAYVYLGDELGPRSKDSSHYNDDNQVQFDRLMDSDLFERGIERVLSGMQKGYVIALTCAEKEPAVCHRSLLVGWALLHRRQIDVSHIQHDGQIESQSDLEYRLMQLTQTEQDMLTSFEQAVALAYQKQKEKYAYKRPA